MSRIAHKFDLSHHKLASLHFQRQSILFWTINLYAVLFFFTVSFNILFENSIYLIFCIANLPDTRCVYLSMKMCYLSICYIECKIINLSILLIISDKCARKSSDTPLIHHFSLSNQIVEYFV